MKLRQRRQTLSEAICAEQGHAYVKGEDVVRWLQSPLIGGGASFEAGGGKGDYSHTMAFLEGGPGAKNSSADSQKRGEDSQERTGVIQVQT